tara:strand:- start:379 stop:708 length:330 start_codon:yes stop_codon:yes gene_type:complete
MIIALHISIALNLLALGLIFWFKKERQVDIDLHHIEMQHIRESMNAIMDDFNNYQVETDRKIIELEKQLDIKIKNHDQRMNRQQKELPSIIGKVVGQIEFAQDKLNRKI